MGVCISFPKLGSALNAWVSPTVSKAVKEPGEYLNVALPIAIGFCIMAVSLVLSVVLALLDRRSESKEKLKHESGLLSGERVKHASKYSSGRGPALKNKVVKKKSGYSDGIKSVDVIES